MIAAKAKELGSPAYKVIQAGAKVLGNNKDGIDFSLEDDYYGDTRFHIPFIAWYQVMNASLALTTMEVLKDGDHGTAAGRNCKYQMAGQNGDHFAGRDRGWCT